MIVDPNKEVILSRDVLHSRCDYTPYEGRYLRGYPVATISRGEVVMRDGEFTGRAGRGRARRAWPAHRRGGGCGVSLLETYHRLVRDGGRLGVRRAQAIVAEAMPHAVATLGRPAGTVLPGFGRRDHARSRARRKPHSRLAQPSCGRRSGHRVRR